jgi:hypothetical protein
MNYILYSVLSNLDDIQKYRVSKSIINIINDTDRLEKLNYNTACAFSDDIGCLDNAKFRLSLSIDQHTTTLVIPRLADLHIISPSMRLVDFPNLTTLTMVEAAEDEIYGILSISLINLSIIVLPNFSCSLLHRFENLKSLTIRLYTEIGDLDISDLDCLPSLQYLDITEVNNLVVSRPAVFAKLQTISIVEIDMIDRGFFSIARFPILQSLTMMAIGSNLIMQNLGSLTYLETDCDISGTNLPNMVNLTISGSGIINYTLLGMPLLEYLSLYDCKHLSAEPFKFLKKLKNLHIVDCPNIEQKKDLFY